MKLLFCTDSYITGGGGVASYAHDFVETLRDVYDFSIITSDSYSKTNSDKEDVYRVRSNDFSENNAKEFITLIQNIHPDILVNSSFPLVSMIVPFIDNRIKVVSISHFVNGPLMWVAAINGDYNDSIISLSSYCKENIIHDFKIKDAHKIHVVFNFMPPCDKINEGKRNRKTLKIVYPGGENPLKSADVVCKAIKKLLKTDIPFELYWTGKTTLSNAGLSFLRTKTIADCLPLDTRVKHIGCVSREESMKLLADANIFLLPSRGEGFPITLIEAMRSGCIPIVSDAKHGSLDAITHGENGFIVRQGNADDIVLKIQDICLKHDKYSYVYDNSYQYYKTYLTRDVWKRKMLDILSKPMDHRTRISTFDNKIFQQKVSLYHKKLKKHWLWDRFQYLRLFFYYRYVRYLV